VGVLPVEASAEAAPLEVALERAAPGSRVPAAEPPPVQARRGVARQLWFWIIVALAAGGGAGFLAPAFPAAGTALQYAGTFGELFLKALRYLAGPLVFSSIISAVGGHEDPRELGSLSWKMLAYYLFTSAAACGIGLGVSALIEPGKYLVLSSLPSAGAASVAKGSVPTLGAFLSGLIPGDPITPFLTANTLQVVFMAVVAGASLLLARTFGPEKVRALAGKAASGASFAQEGVMRLVGFVMLSAPLAVFGLTGKLFSNGGLGALAGMGAYMGTVLLGLALLMVFYSALVKAFAGISPRRYLKGLRDPMLTGFSTASSSATMPVSLKAALKLGVSPPVANLMITLGAAINMEGTALYQSVAVMFLAQAFGVSLSPGSILFILAVLLASSLGTPGAPGAGMAILATVMGGVGIPLEGIALILGVDRILDMARTSANVAGDITSAVMMDELLKRGKARRLNARAEKP
jgi:Na+/H+-dicarboxylate symporter